MTDTTQTATTLSPATQASVQGLTRARNDVAAWTENLEQALADDVAATPPRLTPPEAAAIAKANGVQPPPAPGSTAEAKETTPAMNQAQLDAQTKTAEAEAAKDEKIAETAAAKDERERDRLERLEREHEHEREREHRQRAEREQHEAAEKAKEERAKAEAAKPRR